MSKEDELAFPVYENRITDGLTKREYFAVRILQGFIAVATEHNEDERKLICSEAVEFSEQLIKELEK